jgi:RNA polymerase sigma factor for flagellar operon FliA
VAWRQARERMLGAVRALPDRERQVIVLHYLHGLTFEHIGAVLELTKGRISQLHREALLMLRAGLGPVEHFTLVR